MIKKIRDKDPDISIGNHTVSSSIWNKFARVIEIAQADSAHAIPAFRKTLIGCFGSKLLDLTCQITNVCIRTGEIGQLISSQ